MVQTSSIRVAIIIPILNEKKALPDLVEALLHSGANEVIFVDGGSVDGSLEWLEKKVETKTLACKTFLQRLHGICKNSN